MVFFQNALDYVLVYALDTAVVVATVLGVGMLVPQAVAMARTRDFSGVSATWIGGGVAINGGWVVYALSTGLAGLLPVSFGALALYLWMATMLARHSPKIFTRVLISAGGVGAMFAIAGVVGGTGALGLTVALTYSAQFGPAAWSALSSKDVSGVSRSTWVMALVEAIIWAIYGGSVGDTALFFGGTGATVMSALVLVGLVRHRSARGRSLAVDLAHDISPGMPRQQKDREACNEFER